MGRNALEKGGPAIKRGGTGVPRRALTKVPVESSPCAVLSASPCPVSPCLPRRGQRSCRASPNRTSWTRSSPRPGIPCPMPRGTPAPDGSGDPAPDGSGDPAPDGPGAPTTSSCEPGSACVVIGKPCVVGSAVCEGGGGTCVETTRLQPNGVACGAGSVCLDGLCVSCGGIGLPCCGGMCNGASRCAGGDVVSPTCEQGICREQVSRDCTSCEDCVGDRCLPRSCGTDRSCVNGQCVVDCGTRSECGGQCGFKACNGGCIAASECCNCDTMTPRCSAAGNNTNLLRGTCEAGVCNPDAVAQACGEPGCNLERRACNECDPKLDGVPGGGAPAQGIRCRVRVGGPILIACFSDGSDTHDVNCAATGDRCDCLSGDRSECCGGPGNFCCSNAPGCNSGSPCANRRCP